MQGFSLNLRKSSANKTVQRENENRLINNFLFVFSVDGGYSDWSSWSLCTATCNNGTQQRLRSCTNPPPANGGKQCTGPDKETRICGNSNTCPLPGESFL